MVWQQQHSLYVKSHGDESLLTFCGPYMGNIKPNPTSDCCKAATSVFDKVMAIGHGIRDLCNCYGLLDHF